MGTTRTADPAAAPSKPLTLLERRQHRLKNRPSIDFELVKADSGSDLAAITSDLADRHSISRLFDVHEALGQGTTGVVSRARRRSDGQEVALKIVRTDDEELLRIARDEFELLRTIRHPHIIEAYDFFVYPVGAVVVLSYFAGSTLEKAVAENRAKNCMPETTALDLCKKLLLAVDHLHSQGIIHRDIKATNILVSDDQSDLKLVDFNTARRVLEGGALTMTGTVDYLPPEVILGESPSDKSDIWGVGLCLHLMLSGALPLERRLFSSRRDFAQALGSQQQVQLVGEQWQQISQPCKMALRSCLEPSPEQRATAADVLASEWMSTEHQEQPIPSYGA